MKAQVLTQLANANPALVAGACLGLILFLGVFVGALVWVLRRGSDEEYRMASLLPFESNHAQLGGKS